MKPHGGATAGLRSVRLHLQRFAFAMLVLAAFALMLLGKADTVLVERVSTSIADAVAPAMEMLSQPAASVSNAVGSVRDLADVRAENARLRAENERLLRWQQVARAQEAELAQLHSLLNYVPDPAAKVVTARVIADTGGAFAHSLLLNAGAQAGIRKGQAVLTGVGLLGRIAEVGEVSSRALLITDINSRIPVMVENTRVRAILAGDNTTLPRLLYLRSTATVSPGDRVVTSGLGEAFPPGLPLGVVAAAGDDGVRVQPFADRDRIGYVMVVDYGLEGILTELSGRSVPAGAGR